VIEFRVLGSLDLRGSEGQDLLSVLSQPKRLALLVYLALASPRGFHRRDRLVGLFWPELDQDRARAALRKSLHYLRRSLGEGTVLSRGDEAVGLDFQRIWCDVVAFEEALERGALEEALKFCRGRLLDGFSTPESSDFEQWLEAERRHFQRQAVDAACHLGDRAAEGGDLAAAIQWMERARDLDPLQERPVRKLLQFLDRSGERSRAIRLYETFSVRLREELEVEPAPETQALAQSIRTREKPRPAAAAPAGLAAGEASLGTPDAEAPAHREDHPEEPEAPEIRLAPRRSHAESSLEEELRNDLAPALEVVRLLGRGSMANVYLAREAPLKRLVAVKVLAPDLAGDRTARLRFEREAQAAARLYHPNICTVFSVGTLASGLPYLVMPYVKGRSLAERLKAEGRLPPAELRRILRDVSAALAAAHRMGIIHRDVRPDNVLHDEESGRLLLCDFGIAGILETGEDRPTQITATNERVGSPTYMSPEQLNGDPPTDRTDVYSLGVMAYELLTGRPPRALESARARVEAALSTAAEALSGEAEKAHREVLDLIQRCLSTHPLHRPSAADIMRKLGPAAVPQDVEDDERPDPLSELLRRVRERRFLWIIIPYILGVFATFQSIDPLEARGYLPEISFPLLVTGALYGFVAVTILTWFHGKKGRQTVPVIEMGLLAIVAAAWFVTSLFVLLKP
jgi:serine/threonine-protein kinase